MGKTQLGTEEKLFTQLYEETHQKAYYVALKYLKNEDDALDAVQDSYVKAFANLANLDDIENFAPWMYQITANQSKDILKKNNPLLFRDEETQEYVLKSIPETDELLLPVGALESEVTQKQIRDIIDELSPVQKEVILLYYFQEQSIKEVASTMGTSESTVMSRLAYAREKIKVQVEAMAKKGDKLYSVGFLPFIYQFIKSDIANTAMTPDTAASLANTIKASIDWATLSILGVSSVGVGTAAKATGLLGKIKAALSGSKAVIAAVASVTVVATGVTVAVVHSPVVEWQEPVIEELMRQELNKPEGNIRQKDLDYIEKIVLLGDTHMLFNAAEVNKDYDIFGSVDGRVSYGVRSELTEDMNPYTDGRYSEHGTVENLADFANFRNLETIEIVMQPVSDLSPLQEVSFLQELYLYDTFVEDLTPLSGHKRLYSIHVDQGIITDIAHLSQMDLPNIEMLSFVDSPVKSADVLGSIPLTDVQLSGTQIYDIDFLTQQPIASTLRFLDLQWPMEKTSNITDYSPLSSLNALEQLSIGRITTKDFVAVQKLTELEELYVWFQEGEEITPGMFQEFTKLEKLMVWSAESMDVPYQEHVEKMKALERELQRMFPTAEIYTL